MMEVRLDIDDAYVHEMQRKLGERVRPFDMVVDGLTILRWAIDEVAAGRLILSSKVDGTDFNRLVMPALSQAEQVCKQSRSASSEAQPVQPPIIQK